MGGLFGSLMLGFLADEGIGGQARGGVFFGKQLCACIFTAIYSFLVSWLLLKGISLFMSVVPDASEIAMGLDVSLHGEQAYDDDVLNDVSKSNPKVRAASHHAMPACSGTCFMYSVEDSCHVKLAPASHWDIRKDSCLVHVHGHD
jgi:hypothetical protein